MRCVNERCFAWGGLLLLILSLAITLLGACR